MPYYSPDFYVFLFQYWDWVDKRWPQETVLQLWSIVGFLWKQHKLHFFQYVHVFHVCDILMPPRYPYGHEELAVCEDVDQVYL